MRGSTSQHTFPSQWNTRKRPFRCRFRAFGPRSAPTYPDRPIGCTRYCVAVTSTASIKDDLNTNFGAVSRLFSVFSNSDAVFRDCISDISNKLVEILAWRHR